MNDRWSAEIDQLAQAFQHDFGKLSSDELNWKPNAHTWSVAQILHHIIVVNESYYPIINQLRNQTYYTPRYGQIGFINRMFGKMVLNAVKPDQKRKIKTFPIWEPERSQVRGDIVHQFVAHQHELKTVVLGCGDLIKAGTVISSPANRMIVYKLETAFDIMIAHEKRHLLQAREVNQSRTGQSAAS